MGGLLQLFWRRGGDFHNLGHRPLFGLLSSASELSWRLWVCHLHADVLQGAYNEAQGPLEGKSAAILGLIGSDQFSS